MDNLKEILAGNSVVKVDAKTGKTISARKLTLAEEKRIADLLIKSMRKRQKLTERQIKDLAFEALEAAVRVIQERLGVETGDTAGLVFSGGEVAEKFRQYIRTELLEREEAE